jgi:hypothetical protein
VSEQCLVAALSRMTENRTGLGVSKASEAYVAAFGRAALRPRYLRAAVGLPCLAREQLSVLYHRVPHHQSSLFHGRYDPLAEAEPPASRPWQRRPQKRRKKVNTRGSLVT